LPVPLSVRRPRLRRSAARYAEVDTFDALDDVAIVDVDLPRASLPEMRSRTVQPEVAPELIAPAHASAFALRVAITANGCLAHTSGAVIAPDGRLVRETVWDEAAWRRAFDPPPALGEATYVPGRHASIITAWSHGFYHWMFEALPRLAVLEASGVEFDRLIVPANLARFHVETLALLGFDNERLTPFTGHHLRVDELVWPAPLAPVGRPSPASVGWLRARLGMPAAVPSRRLYLKRSHTRKVVNERALLEVLEPRGFEVVEPDTLALRDQVTLFSEAAVAVGPHGAAFSNGIFSSRLDVLELYQSRHVNSSTLCALAAAGHGHWSLLCDRALRLARPTHHDIEAPIAEVERSLRAMGVDA
jgi:capsular polysaccharide biosynthesis protein